MIPLPFWLTNLQFIVGAFGAFAFFAAAWLNVDSWAVRRELKTGLRAAGFFALAMWSALHGIDLSSAWADLLTAALVALGSLATAVSYIIDRPPALLKDSDAERTEQQRKIEQIVQGPPETKPHPPSPGAPLERGPHPAARAGVSIPSALSRQPLPRPGASPPLTPTAKAIGLRTEALLKLPKREQRRRTRLRASAIGLLFLAALGAAGAYFISSKTKLFGSEGAEPSFIEATPAAEPTATPTPATAATPTPAAAPTVTIKDTETGYLNVRASAGTTAAILTKINPGDSYELLEENEAGDWYKIKIDDDTAGWIAARYATKNAE